MESGPVSATSLLVYSASGSGQEPSHRPRKANYQNGTRKLDRIPRGILDNRQLPAYTCTMSADKTLPVGIPCLCGTLRQASRAVSRLYDEELRSIGLRTTQYSLLQLLRRSGEIRQRDLADVTRHDETSLTRSLRPLVDARWVAVRAGEDRREKWLTITAGGVAKLEEARPAWERAQARIQALLPEGAWQGLMEILPEVARLTAES
jgi:DNA-binding MarR family transcriptional regulator